MNRYRRMKLHEAARQLREVSGLKDVDEVIAWINVIDGIKSDEEYAYDNIPENLQSSVRAEESEEAIDLLDDALDNLNSAVEDEDSFEQLIETAVDQIERAAM